MFSSGVTILRARHGVLIGSWLLLLTGCSGPDGTDAAFGLPSYSVETVSPSRCDSLAPAVRSQDPSARAVEATTDNAGALICTWRGDRFRLVSNLTEGVDLAPDGISAGERCENRPGLDESSETFPLGDATAYIEYTQLVAYTRDYCLTVAVVGQPPEGRLATAKAIVIAWQSGRK